MLELTFGEQVKIILSRKGMTIKELAEKIEKQTGKKMSRQNLTQRLGIDNFQLRRRAVSVKCIRQSRRQTLQYHGRQQGRCRQESRRMP